MRTGIYVKQRTTVTVRASDPQDALVRLRRFRVETCGGDAHATMRDPDAAGTHQLDAGIYLIVSRSPMQIEGESLTTQIALNDKDIFPDPGVTVLGLVPGATAAMVREFFAVTKGIEVGDGPESADPDADPVAEDPDGL